MNKFLKRLLIFFAIGGVPALILIGFYIKMDPFRVLRSYVDYEGLVAMPNRDFFSTEKYLNNNKNNGYNSFIFGSSRTMGFNPKDWNTHLDSNAIPYSFDAFSESMWGIHKKIVLIDSLGGDLKNVFILLDRDNTFVLTGNSEGLIFEKHPALTGEAPHKIKLRFFRAYFEFGFLVSFFSYITTDEFKPYMAKFINPFVSECDSLDNGLHLSEAENMLRRDSAAYYKKYAHLFYERDGKEKIDTNIFLKNEHVEMMDDMKRIFNKHKTNYKFVVGPLFDMTKFPDKDLKEVERIFGKDKVYDYSGKNKFTVDKTNYYEASHYRPQVGKAIFEEVYK